MADTNIDSSRLQTNKLPKCDAVTSTPNAPGALLTKWRLSIFDHLQEMRLHLHITSYQHQVSVNFRMFYVCYNQVPMEISAYWVWRAVGAREKCGP